jgi:tRNA1(Val) A37 N6-methylase TrmN6
MIHRTERLPEVLMAAQSCLGSLEVLPLIPREGRESELFLLRARKIGRAPFKLHAPKILHAKAHHTRDEEDYTAEIAAVLRDGAVLSW